MNQILSVMLLNNCNLLHPAVACTIISCLQVYHVIMIRFFAPLWHLCLHCHIAFSILLLSFTHPPQDFVVTYLSTQLIFSTSSKSTFSGITMSFSLPVQVSTAYTTMVHNAHFTILFFNPIIIIIIIITIIIIIIQILFIHQRLLT